MPDYGEILRFLAQNPPQFEAEKKLHASMLELLAQCLRSGEPIGRGDAAQGPARDDPARLREALDEHIANAHRQWVHFS
ncbi:MAG: hypothetical protein Kow0032_00420 [Methyloligellaceae bacterium]